MKETENRLGYFLRDMEEKDIPQVLEIDREAFPTQWPYPTYSSFKQELRNRLAHYIVACRPNSSGGVVPPACLETRRDNRGFFSRLFNFKGGTSEEMNGVLPPPSQEHIIGMAGFWLMVGEAHIITIAARQACRRMGIGEKLLIAIIERAAGLNASMVTLEVRVSNSQARELYKKYGFGETGVRHKYYSDNGEDAIIMSTQSISSPDYVLKLRHLKEMHRDRWGA